MAEFEIEKKKMKSTQDIKSRNHVVQQKQNIDSIIQMARTSPNLLTPNDILQLQRTIGNKAVGQLLASKPLQRAENELGKADEKPILMKEGLYNAGSKPIDVNTNSVVQMASKYAKLNKMADFSAKHLHVTANQYLCSAMLIARKYKGWKSSTDKHSLITSTTFPAAWKVPNNIKAGNVTTSALTSILYQFIASDPAVVKAGSKWTVKSKMTARNPKVGGNASALNPAENCSNGNANVRCEWQVDVNHLAGAVDNGLNPTTVEWNGATSKYKVAVNGSTQTFDQNVVEQ
jgi:hypothetical protein